MVNFNSQTWDSALIFLQCTKCCTAPYIVAVNATKDLSIHRGLTMFDFLSRRYQRWQLYNRTVAELESLTNRDLADLGIARSDIPRIARDAIR
jgi:uncharacterized protein YjiS (DUF1127 family)